MWDSRDGCSGVGRGSSSSLTSDLAMGGSNLETNSPVVAPASSNRSRGFDGFPCCLRLLEYFPFSVLSLDSGGHCCRTRGQQCLLHGPGGFTLEGREKQPEHLFGYGLTFRYLGWRIPLVAFQQVRRKDRNSVKIQEGK